MSSNKRAIEDKKTYAEQKAAVLPAEHHPVKLARPEERQAFEKAIDKAPHDAANHLVYADWLDEHGEHDEAAFRRSMGNWVRETMARIPGRRRLDTPHTNRYMPFVVHPLHVPEGVTGSALRIWNNGRDSVEEGDSYRQAGVLYPMDPTHADYRHGNLRWQTYRNMEEAFRRNFMENRKTKKVKLSRGYTHADFHRQILHDINTERGQPEQKYTPKDPTSSLVYADWLEEQGMPKAAAFIRRAAPEGTTSIMHYPSTAPPASPTGFAVGVYQGLGVFGPRVGRRRPSPTLNVAMYAPHPEGKGALAFNIDVPVDEGNRVAEELLAEGHAPHNDGAKRRLKLARPKIDPPSELERHAVAAMQNRKDPMALHVFADHVEEHHPNSVWLPVIREMQSGGDWRAKVREAKKIHTAEKRHPPQSTPWTGAANAGGVYFHPELNEWRVGSGKSVVAPLHWWDENEAVDPDRVVDGKKTTMDRALHLLRNMPGGVDNVIGMALAAHFFAENRGLRAENAKRLKLARLGPAVTGRTHTGETRYTHEFTDDEGTPLGTLSLVPREKALHVDWVGLHGAAAGEQAGAAGAKHIRSLLPQIAAAYPQHEILMGRRAGGAHRGELRGVELAPHRLAREQHADPLEPLVPHMLGAIRDHKNKLAIHVLADHAEEVAPDHPFVRGLRGFINGDARALDAYWEQSNDEKHARVFHRGAGVEIAPHGLDKPSLNIQLNTPPIYRFHTTRSLRDRGRRASEERALAYIRTLPGGLTNLLHAALAAHYFTHGKSAESLKLARTGMIDSTNHRKRVELAKKVLSEAGFGRAIVKAAIAHYGREQQPGVLAAIEQATNPQHALYTAAWIGMLTQQPRVSVFHPGDGQDALHVITSPHPTEHVSEYLRRAGVPRFSSERTATGTRAFVLDPDGQLNPAAWSAGLDGQHTTLRGKAHTLEGRELYQKAIREAEEATNASNSGAE